MMAYYDRQNFSEQALALHFANLFGEDNQVQTLHFARGEDAAGGRHGTRPLQWCWIGRRMRRRVSGVQGRQAPARQSMAVDEDDLPARTAAPPPPRTG